MIQNKTIFLKYILCMTTIHLQQCHLLQLMLNVSFALVFQTKNAWKFPGGLSDPGENIGECRAQQSKKKKNN